MKYYKLIQYSTGDFKLIISIQLQLKINLWTTVTLRLKNITKSKI